MGDPPLERPSRPLRRVGRWLSAAVSDPLRRHYRDLPVERVRSRVSAYVYGNVLVLAAVLAASPRAVDTGAALLNVVITTVTTYAAHVLAHDVAQRIAASPDEHAERVREELADAAPIVYSGLAPVVLLALAALQVLPADVAQPVASAVVVARLAITAWRIEALSGQPAATPAAWTGLAVAAVGTLIAVAKWVLHV